MNKELQKYIKKNLKEEKKKTKKFSLTKILLFPFTFISFFSRIFNSDSFYEMDSLSNDEIEQNNDNLKIDNLSKEKKKESLNDSIISVESFIKSNEKYSDFQTTLFKMIDERNLTDSYVYNKVHLDRRLFSKIRNNKNYHPSKETIILLGLALELNEEEFEKLLDSASYSLPRNNHYDLIIRFCFIKGIYNIKEINELLEQYHCKLFNY